MNSTVPPVAVKVVNLMSRLTLSVPPVMVKVPVPEAKSFIERVPALMVKVPLTVIVPLSVRVPPELIVTEPPELMLRAVIAVLAAVVRTG